MQKTSRFSTYKQEKIYVYSNKNDRCKNEGEFMKKKKLNWNNLFTLLVFVWSVAVIIYDFCVFTINLFIGKSTMYTWIGFFTYGLCWLMLIWSYEDLKDAANKKRNKAC